MKFTGERMIPEHNKKNVIYGEHIARYIFASQFVKGKKVLDIACGSGYGSGILGENGADEVHGGDISEETVAYATEEFGADNIHFQVENAEKMSFEDDMFDAIVSFETIEHLEDYTKFLCETKRVLKDGGVALISTPNKAIYPEGNAFHTKEFHIDEFETELKKYFKNVVLEYQDNFLTNSIYKDASELEKARALADVEEEHEPLYIVAICSDGEIPEYERVSFTFSSDELGSGMMQEKLENVIKWAENLDAEIEQKNARIVELQGEVEERNEHIAKLDEKMTGFEESMNSLHDINRELHEKNAREEEYKYLLSNTAEVLEIKNREIHTLSHSWSYRIGQWITWPFRLFFPPQSKRRTLLKLCLKSIRHPFKFLRRLTPGNIGKLFKAMRDHDMSFVENKFDQCLHRTAFQATQIQPITLDLIEDVDTNEPLVFEEHEDPLVSIVIPVYNNWDYNYKCLLSILRYTGDVKYELIIGDDCSSDQTKDILEYVKGITVVRNKENLMFLKNCNAAAKVARGKYIFLLNNDTNVQKGWLTSLVDMMEEDEKIGMAGSKLVYPDGELQEAGGIIWEDASAWNYGRNGDPSLPEYNYVKEVDYISGAAIIIRRDLWEKIGGFDEMLAPAYYEDSDLAFEVRKHGYKMMYQPKSVVVHFEGKSHGTDTGAGLKKYQIENREKLLNKWGDVLKDHFANGQNAFLARDRSRDKKTILIIDHYVPTYDKDAGSRTIYQYMKLLVDMGYNVKFLGDNFHKAEPYTSELQQMGVEVLYGQKYQENWRSWVRENAAHLDFVYFHRSHITVKYIDFIKNNTDAKIIYNAVDFSFLRERRQYEVTGDKKYLEQAKHSERVEYSLFKKSDVIITISEYEQKMLQEKMPDKEVTMIPTYVYDEFPEGDGGFEERTDLTFVGGFAHEPNTDGIMWFVEDIMPHVLKEIPEIKLNVIGSKPPQEVLDLASDHVNVTGFVSDEELNEYYEKTRVIVAPLRFGAGVKGKIIEAIAHSIPFVTTEVGAEGIVDSEDIMSIADTDEEFARKMVELYKDESLWRKRKESLGEYSKKYLSAEHAKDIVSHIFS